MSNESLLVPVTNDTQLVICCARISFSASALSFINFINVSKSFSTQIIELASQNHESFVGNIYLFHAYLEIFIVVQFNGTPCIFIVIVTHSRDRIVNKRHSFPA